MDSFVELNDDCIAALRYGTEPLWGDGVFGGRVADYGGLDMMRFLGL